MAPSSVTIMGVPGITSTVLSANAVKTLGTAVAPAKYSGIVGVYLYLETNNIRYAWGVDPVEATPLGCLLMAGQTLQLNNAEAALNLRFISAIAGSHGRLQVTYLFKF